MPIATAPGKQEEKFLKEIKTLVENSIFIPVALLLLLLVAMHRTIELNGKRLKYERKKRVENETM